MMFRLSLSLFFLLFPVTALDALTQDTPSLAPNLDSLLSFQNPKNCLFGDRLLLLFKRMEKAAYGSGFTSTGSSIVVKGVDILWKTALVIQPNMNIDGVTVSTGRRYTISSRGRWHGLHVINLSYETGEATSVYRWRVIFSDQANVVRNRLNQFGFLLPSVGRYRCTPTAGNDLGVDEALNVGMGIDSVPEGAALTCTTTVNY